MLIYPKAIGTIARMWADNVRSSFMDSLADLKSFSERVLCTDKSMYIHGEKAFASYHQLARNDLVTKMRGDWILMLDTDHKFQPDLLIRLLEIQKQSGAGVVTGLYLAKHSPHPPVANVWSSDGQCIPLLNWDRNADYIPIGPCGGGCLLIMKSTLDIIGPNPFNQIGGFSEDYSFFARCRAANIPCVLAPKIQANHVIETAIAAEDYIPPPNAPIYLTDPYGTIQDAKIEERSVVE